MSDTTDRRMGLREACERAWVRGTAILFASLVMVALAGGAAFALAAGVVLLVPSWGGLLVPLGFLLAGLAVPLALGSIAELRGRGNGSFFEP